MGIGDEIMASGHALVVNKKTGKRVIICDKRGRPRWSDMWRGLNWIVGPTNMQPELWNRVWFTHPPKTPPTIEPIQNSMQCRPYIRYPFTRATGINYSGWKARDHRGFIQLSNSEIEFAADAAKKIGSFVIIEPNVKQAANPNKQWGMSRWQDLADILQVAGMNPHQIGPPGTTRLEGVPIIHTPDFRFGAAMLKFAKWSYLPDGGLHHAAAVLGLPATVLWGGVNDPEYLGYPEHHNVFIPPACRTWRPCQHCQSVWAALRPEDVFEWSLQHIRNWKWQRSLNL